MQHIIYNAIKTSGYIPLFKRTLNGQMFFWFAHLCDNTILKFNFILHYYTHFLNRLPIFRIMLEM